MSTDVCVAIVDDEEPVRRALGRLLRLSHYDVTLFPSGETFLVSLDIATPDCLIMDVNMSGMSGLDLLQRLRSVSIRIPTICITGAEDLELLQEVHAAGAAQLLQKPISSPVLLDAIRMALGTGD
jgi:FixJ family two-component response regulator